MASNHAYFTLKTTPSVCKQAITRFLYLFSLALKRRPKERGEGGGVLSNSRVRMFNNALVKVWSCLPNIIRITENEYTTHC